MTLPMKINPKPAKTGCFVFTVFCSREFSSNAQFVSVPGGLPSRQISCLLLWLLLHLILATTSGAIPDIDTTHDDRMRSTELGARLFFPQVGPTTRLCLDIRLLALASMRQINASRDTAASTSALPSHIAHKSQASFS